MAIPTTSPVMTLGRMRTMTMRMGDEPMEVEASTKDSSLTASVWPRMKRAKPGAKTSGERQGVVVHRGPDDGHDGQGEHERREGQAGVGAPHQEVVEPATTEPGHEADDQREDQGQAHRLEGHLHGALGAVNEAREHVAPQVVGARASGWR